jgi:hypothetical protein
MHASMRASLHQMLWQCTLAPAGDSWALHAAKSNTQSVNCITYPVDDDTKVGFLMLV